MYRTNRISALESLVLQRNVAPHCPHCSSGLAIGDAICIHNGVALQQVFCPDCERGWVLNWQPADQRELPRRIIDCEVVSIK